MKADALDRIVNRLATSLPELAAARERGSLPHVTEGGRWQLAEARAVGHYGPEDARHGTWTGGFVGGQLWLASRWRPSVGFEAEAAAVVDLLTPRAYDRTTHDLGFLFWPSAILGYLATRAPGYRELALTAANTLADRLHPAGIVQAWGTPETPGAAGESIVDTLLNLTLLWWAAREGEERCGEVARSHARVSAREFVRPDGTTWHRLRFGTDGAVLERGTVQGYAADSTWSRGQAWALAGFVDAWRATGGEWAREAAERVGNAFLARLPDDLVPPYDFDAPEGAPPDASAAAIAAYGLLRLPNRRPDGEALLAALVERCLAPADEDGLLASCSYHVPWVEGIGGATAWGDFFLLDGLLTVAAPERSLDPLIAEPTRAGRA